MTLIIMKSDFFLGIFWQHLLCEFKDTVGDFHVFRGWINVQYRYYFEVCFPLHIIP
jgi:hypothetical protein